LQSVPMTAARQVLISQGDSATNFIINWLHVVGAKLKLTDVQVIKKFSGFYETKKFITVSK
jgi:hypothetical protein